MCHIQASKVVAAGYLQGSIKSINEENWTENLNALPRLNKLDVEVVVCNIHDPKKETNRSGSKNKNKSFAAHVLCAKENEEAVNLALCNTYGKNRKASRAAGDLPEGRAMKYVPYNSKGLLVKSADEESRLQKTGILQST